MGDEQAAAIGTTGAPTRRRLIGSGAAAVAGGAAVLAVPRWGAVAAAATAAKPCVPDPAGFRTGALAATPDGRRVWATDLYATTITTSSTKTLQRGRSIDVGGTPAGIAIAPDGALALVTTSGDRAGLTLVDLRTSKVDRLDVGANPGAVAFTRSGKTGYVVDRGVRGTLTRVRPGSGQVGTPIALGAHPRGLALDPSGAFALIALNSEAAVAVVDLRRGRVVRRIATAAYPAQLAISPDGRRALVTHNGFGARAVSLIDLGQRRVVHRTRVGSDPAGVAFSRSGAGALVTGAGNGTVTVLDGRTGRRLRTIKAGGAPRAVAICGNRGITADSRTGNLTAVRLGLSA